MKNWISEIYKKYGWSSMPFSLHEMDERGSIAKEEAEEISDALMRNGEKVNVRSVDELIDTIGHLMRTELKKTKLPLALIDERICLENYYGIEASWEHGRRTPSFTMYWKETKQPAIEVWLTSNGYLTGAVWDQAFWCDGKWIPSYHVCGSNRADKLASELVVLYEGKRTSYCEEFFDFPLVGILETPEKIM